MVMLYTVWKHELAVSQNMIVQCDSACKESTCGVAKSATRHVASGCVHNTYGSDKW